MRKLYAQLKAGPGLYIRTTSYKRRGLGAPPLPPSPVHPMQELLRGTLPHQLDWLPWVAMESVILHRNPTGSFLQREKKKKLCCQLPKLFAIWEQLFILQKRSFVESVDRASFLSTLSRGKKIWNLVTRNWLQQIGPVHWHYLLIHLE